MRGRFHNPADCPTCVELPHQSDTAHQVGRASYDRPLFGGEV